MNAQRRIAVLTALVAIAVVTLLWKRHSAPQTIPAEVPHSPAVSPVPQTPAPAPQPIAPRVETASPVVHAVYVTPSPPPPKPVQAQSQPSAKPAKEPLQDPDARDALALVGLDSDAEQYWLAAIYDTSLPDSEREDLMEDLNEVGFADPKNLTTDDLPLIINRLQIIEQIEPSADPFMKKHLDEAYKDLANMYSQVTGQ